MKKTTAMGVTLVLFIGVCVGIITERIISPAIPTFETAYAQQSPQPLPSFALGSQQQHTKSLFEGQWSLVFFGYTSCPDVCPTELYNLNNVAKLLAEQGKVMPQVVFISVDPNRDTDNMLTSYAHFYNDDFIGITGETSEIDKLVKRFGVLYQKTFLANNGQYVSVPYTAKIPEEQASSYLINHSSRVYLVNPDGEYVAAFAPPHSAEKIAADVAKLNI